MIHVNVLSSGFTNPNSAAFLYPLILFRTHIEERGYKIKFFFSESRALSDCDFLLIDHKAFTKNWHEHKSIERLAKLHKDTKVIWCDQSDSTGTFLGQVLPYVQKYLKSQIILDIQAYAQSYYGDRVFTDYYHKKYHINDDIFYNYAPASKENLHKIGISWNSGLMNHGYYGCYINRLREFLPLNSLLFLSKSIRLAKASRSLDISCRMGISYERPTIRFQRECLREKLKYKMPVSKISRAQYLHELSSSKITISPFGFGEITLKDFEAFLCGSALMKPDLSHMRTWPDFYQQNQTYIALDWDLSDLESKIEYYLNNDDLRRHIADQGQKTYELHTTSQGAGNIFSDHFKTIIS